MSAAAFSLLVFSIYVGTMAVIILIFPATVASWLGLPAPKDQWIYVVAMFAGGLSAYYAFAALKELTSFIVFTVFIRGPVVLFVLIMLFAGLMPKSMLIPGVIDLLCAVWTFLAWRSDLARSGKKSG